MGFFDIFRRPAPIRDEKALADFIDRNAAFLVQRGIYEYARARAGVYAKILFTEKAFLDAMEVARWQAYPLGLAMIAEMVDGVLHAEAGEGRRARLDELAALVLGVFDRYPAPKSLGAAEWAEARAELARQLARIGLHPPKAAKDIPEPFAERYFALMPIHERLRALDFPSMRAYLSVALLNIHEQFVQQLDAPAFERMRSASTA
jgi:hypothetical protein